MLRHEKVRSRTARLLTALTILVLFYSILTQLPWDGFRSRKGETVIDYYENPWTLRLGDTLLDSDLQLPAYRKLETGQLYTLSTTMTYDGSLDEMPYGVLHLDHVYCRVLMDDQVLFSYMPEDLDRWDRAKSPGFIYKAFPVPPDCKGRQLEIQLLPPLNVPLDYGLPDLRFGDFIPMLIQAILRDLPQHILVVLCALLGLVTVLFSSLSLRGNRYQEGISVGVFALLFSLYLASECRTSAYLMGNPYHTYLMNYIPFSLMPNALLGFMRERLPRRHRKLLTRVIWLGSICFLGELALHFFGVLDMRELIPVIHLFYFFYLTLVTTLILIMKNRKRKRALILQLAPALAGMLLDALIYWFHWEIGSNDATFTILGVTVFLVVEVLQAFRAGISVYTESVRSRLYRRMAFIDELTGIGNRRAYDREIDRIISGEQTYHSMIVVSADVNRLKYVNDHYGHAAGDLLIQGAAQILQECVEDRSKVFRTGGDEFAAFLYDVDPERYQSLVQAAREGLESFNAEHAFPLSLAAAHVQIFDHQILEAVQEADRLMYETKARMKAQEAQEAQQLSQTTPTP